MGNQRGDDRFGGNDWQGAGRAPDRSERSHYGAHGGSGEGRGFIERAGEEIRSWFGDDERERARSGQGGEWREEQRGAGPGSGDWRGSGGSMGGSGGSTGERYGGGVSGAEMFGGTGFGGGADHGRRFDRIDAGSTGTHGAHPMSTPAGGAYGSGHGSSARYAAIAGGREERGGQGGHEGGQGGYRGGGSHFDPHYSQWRQRQLDELDRDYEDFCRENQTRFEQEFGTWRQRRQAQRDMIGRVTEHMEVVGSDGAHVGIVDKVRGDQIILTRNDENAGGVHHSIPCAWIDGIDDKVRLNTIAEDAMRRWRSEEKSGAMFGGGSQPSALTGSGMAGGIGGSMAGPAAGTGATGENQPRGEETGSPDRGVLDLGQASSEASGTHGFSRGFSGTYTDRDE